MPSASKKIKVGCVFLPTKTKVARAHTVHTTSACKNNMYTHRTAQQPIRGCRKMNAGKYETHIPSITAMESISWTKFKDRLPFYLFNDKERKMWREERKGKMNEGSELSPPLRLLFNTATERGEIARLSKRKSDRGWSLVTKYEAAASVQSQYVCVCVYNI